MNFDAQANELYREEFDSLAAAVTPGPEALRSMTPDALRDEIAMMWERLGHTVITSPCASEIVTIKANGNSSPSAPIRPISPQPAAAQYSACVIGLLPSVPNGAFT